MQRYEVMSKFCKIFFLVITIIFSANSSSQAQMTVVLDAGHGGKDPGALSSKVKEKNVTLDIALKLGKLITAKYPDVKVIYTRKKDTFVTLNGRAAVANKNNADLFISIHCNSLPSSPETNGVETFVMGEHRNNANLQVAKSENASILFEDDSDSSYNGFDPNSTESYIIFSLMQSEHKMQSLRFAEKVQNQLVKSGKRKNRGVQQAGFLVLYKTSMPSVLVELGFLSNKEEEKLMTSEAGKNEIAAALLSAFDDYKNDLDQSKTIVSQNTNNNEKNNTSTTSGTTYKVQFESRNSRIKDLKSHYKGLDNVEEYFHNGMYKYTAGCFTNKSDADKYCEQLRKKGYSDAFVVKFKDGKRE